LQEYESLRRDTAATQDTSNMAAFAIVYKMTSLLRSILGRVSTIYLVPYTLFQIYALITR